MEKTVVPSPQQFCLSGCNVGTSKINSLLQIGTLPMFWLGGQVGYQLASVMNNCGRWQRISITTLRICEVDLKV